MTAAKIMFLDEDKKDMWAQAGTHFPGEQLHQAIQRALNDAPADQDSAVVYEVRRRDIPAAFDELKKLQSTGRARCYIEVEGDDFREVLRIEATMLDAVMLALALLLDVLIKLLGRGSSTATSGPVTTSPAPPSAHPPKPGYVPSWKRGPQHRVCYEGPAK